jgi:orotate phosphoribosyltransferase
MTQEEVLSIYQQTGALLIGHFLLSSGLHSERYLQSALVLQQPDIATKLCASLAAHFRNDRIEVVISPARGFTISAGERVLVVEDVITTGKSTRETIDVVKKAGGVVIAAGALVDRSGGKAELGVPYKSLVTLDVPTYGPDACPLCKAGGTPIKPGSRGLK